MTKDEARAAAVQATKDFAKAVKDFTDREMANYGSALETLDPYIREMSKAEKIGMQAEISAILDGALV